MSLKTEKLLALLVCAGLTLCGLSGCTAEPDILPTVEPDGEYHIGVTVLDLTNPYYYEVVRGITDRAADQDIRLDVRDPVSDAHRQAEILEQFIDVGVDAILVASLSPQITEPVLKRAMDEGIRVVAWATEVENCDTHISIDEWEMGYRLGVEAGRWLINLPVSQRKLMVLEYPRIPQINNRVKGMEDGLREVIDEYEIVAKKSASNPEEGYRAYMEAAKDNSDIYMVLGINDGGALGALQAVEEMGIDSNLVFIGGCDATPEAVAAVNSGTAYRCTIDLYPYYTGEVALDFALRLLGGESVPSRFTIPTRTIRSGS